MCNEDLESRLQRLETRNRQYAWLCATLVIVSCGVLAAGAGRGAPESIAAQRFQLIDAEGRVRAALAMTAEGGGLAVYSDTGSPLVTLGTSAGEAVLAMFDPDAEPRLLMRVGEQTSLELSRVGAGKVLFAVNEHMTGLSLVDEGGVRRSTYRLHDGDVDLFMYDENKVGRVGLSIGDAGCGLDLLDEAGLFRASLSVEKSGASLRLHDAQERPVWIAPPSANRSR